MEYSSIIENSLPAKKRKACCPSIPSADIPLCLPAKKRVRAVQPFDLNVAYEPLPLEESPEFRNDAGETSVNEDIDDDGIVCAVCESTDGEPTDPIVLCDGCDLMVHASCYGHPLTDGIPEGDWFCARCRESNSAEISCCLCPVSGGALKKTTDGRWAHLVCAIYVPEVYFEDCEGREGIECRKVARKRWGRECYICKSMKGCVLDCSEPKCPMAFHVTCGLKEELSVEYLQRQNRGGLVAAFCRLHTHIWNKQQLTGKFKIVARDEPEK